MANNRLTDAEAERLAILAEECGEIVQIVGKILRHGYESYNPDDPARVTNRTTLTHELGGLLAVQQMMLRQKDVFQTGIDYAAKEKHERMKQYLHHQETTMTANQPQPPAQKPEVPDEMVKAGVRAMVENMQQFFEADRKIVRTILTAALRAQACSTETGEISNAN